LQRANVAVYNPLFPGIAAWAEFSCPFFLLDRLSESALLVSG
jgi:hypothetical protein